MYDAESYHAHLVTVLGDPRAQRVNTHPLCVVVRAVAKILGHLLAILYALRVIAPIVYGRQYFIVVLVFVSIECIFYSYHLLVQLLARTDTDDLEFCAGNGCKRNVGYFHRGDFLDVYLPAPHVFKGVPDEFDPLFKGDHESGHPRIGDRQYSLVRNRQKKWDNGAARSHDVAITHYTEPGVVIPRVGVTRNKQLVGSQFGGAVKIRGATRLIGRKRDNPLHATVNTGINQVHRSNYIGFYAFKGIVFSDGHNLGSGGVNNEFDAIQRPRESVFISHIANKETHSGIVAINLCHFPLLLFITGEDHQTTWVLFRQRHWHEGVTERASTAGNEDG